MLQAGKKTTRVLLQTATVRINHEGRCRRAVCILDSGSQRSFIRKELAEALGLPTIMEEDQAIHTFGTGQPLLKKMSVVSMEVYGTFPSAAAQKIEALVIPKICSAMAVSPCQLARQLKAEGKILADDRLFRTREAECTEEIDLLIGSDQYWSVMQDGIIRRGDGPVAQASHFGWVLNGPPRLTATSNSTFSFVVHTTETDDLDSKVANLWSTEYLGVKAEEDEAAGLDSFVISRDVTGRYEVLLPWKDNVDQLPTNKKLAEARLKRLAKRLREDQELMRDYDDQFQAYLAEELISEVDPTAVTVGVEHYLSHHIVTRQDKASTKRRIVFDAAAKDGGGVSLNDCLHAGPNLNPELMAVLLRFRMKKKAFLGDIEKAFLQISLRPSDRDAVRFLWFASPEEVGKDQPRMKIFRWNRVPFGLTSSPFLLRAVIKHHLEQYRDRYPEAVKLVEDCLYVDDLLGGADSTEEAAQRIREIVLIFREAKMNMRRWLTNDSELDRLLHECPTLMDGGENVAVALPEAAAKVLGISWNRDTDHFTFNPEAITSVPTYGTLTRRQFTSHSSKIFDPLGLLSPTILLVKLQFQGLWKTKLGWDDPLPEEERNRWEDFKTSLPFLNELAIPRWCSGEPDDAQQLHIFCDASEAAFAAVAYLRVKSTNGITCQLVASKTRVAPVDRMTIPRLELMGALLATQLNDYLIGFLGMVNIPTTFWTDSQIVIHWIRGDVTRWK